MLEQLDALDKTIFLFLNGFHSPFRDVIMWWISKKEVWIPLYLGVVIYLAFKFRIKIFIVFGLILLVALISDQISVHLFKNVFERLRPSHDPSLVSSIHLVNGYKGGTFGFISSHAANTFGFVSITYYLIRKKGYLFFMLLWASVVCYSRIYLGVHYLFDILAGALFGWMVGFAVYKVYAVLAKKWQM